MKETQKLKDFEIRLEDFLGELDEFRKFEERFEPKNHPPLKNLEDIAQQHGLDIKKPFDMNALKDIGLGDFGNFGLAEIVPVDPRVVEITTMTSALNIALMNRDVFDKFKPELRPIGEDGEEQKVLEIKLSTVHQQKIILEGLEKAGIQGAVGGSVKVERPGFEPWDRPIIIIPQDNLDIEKFEVDKFWDHLDEHLPQIDPNAPRMVSAPELIPTSSA